MDALYQFTVVPAAAVALTTTLPLPQNADGVVTVGAVGSGFTVTVTAYLVAETQPIVVFLA